MPQRIIALEIAEDRVRAAAAERSWNSIRLTGVFENERAPGEPDVAGALARLAAEAGPGDLVISALPSGLAAKRLLELPFSDARRLNEAVPFELEGHLPFAVDDAVVAFSRVGNRDGKTLVMAATVRKRDLRAHLELLAKAGLTPKVVTLSLLALGALLGRMRNGASPVAHLVVESDLNSTSLVLMDKSGTPRALRTMNRGLLTAAGAPVSADAAAPIVNSMRQTLLAHAGEAERADVVLTGMAAPNAQVRGLLANSLALAVRDGGDLDYSSVFDGAVPAAGRFSACVAMLLGALPAKPLELIDFRQGEFAFRGRVRGDLTPFYVPGILAAAMIAAFALHFALGISASWGRLDRIDRQIGAIVTPVLGKTDPARAKAKLKDGIAKMNQRLQLIGGNVAHHSVLDTLLAVSRALPPRMPVEMKDVQIDANSMKMKGEADQYATVDRAKQLLAKSRYFSSIEVSHAKASPRAGKVDFTIDAKLKDSALGGE
ncbi:MAG: hypothetical protein ACREQI_00280 [Candidatus Binataceae bacterium]